MIPNIPTPVVNAYAGAWEIVRGHAAAGEEDERECRNQRNTSTGHTVRSVNREENNG